MAKFKKPKSFHRARPTEPRHPVSASGAIEAALERFAHPTIPDYAGFDDWLRPQMSVQDRRLVLPPQQSNIAQQTAACIDSLLDLQETYQQRLKAANAQHATTSESYRLLLNRYKLLLHAMEALSPRTKETLAISRHQFASTARLDEGASSCSQNELRTRFFVALAREQDRVALKLLARLRVQDHDPGELEYLEALCHFHANDFVEAVHWANKVPPEAIDHSGARALVLESLAFLARPTELVAQLRQHDPGEITPSFLAYLMQVAIRHADDPDTAVSAFNALGEHWKLATPNTTDDAFYAPFNRNSCRIAREFALQLQGLEEQEEYTRATPSSSDGGPRLSEDDLDVSSRRLLYACMVDLALLDAVLDAKTGERFVPIVKRLLNVPYQTDFADFAEALRTQWELGPIRVFLDNVAANIEGLLTAPYDEKWSLLELAYAEASATCHPCLIALEKALGDRGRLVARERVLREDVQTAILRQHLSRTGWHFYQQASWTHEVALSERSSWQDAGMISLGFFRILEVELNQRIIRPLAKGLDWTALKLLAKPAKALKEHIIPENVLDKLGHVRDGDASSLELGPLYLLLQRTQTVIEPDKDRKVLLHNAIAHALTENGTRAYEDGRLADTINPEARDKYRNPPAHSRYLAQPIATECKHYVEGALRDIIAWTSKPDEPA